MPYPLGGRERSPARRSAAPVEHGHGVKHFQEAQHRGAMAEGGHVSAPRWIPIAAAFLALLAASTGLLAGLRATQANATKSDAILLTARAVDIYSEYDTRSVRQHIYEAALEGAVDAAHAKRLRGVAQHEREAKAPLLPKARKLDKESNAAIERAEHILVSHEILAVATTLFEIAIVLVSITALVGSRILPISAVIATTLGLIIALRGALY